MLVLAGLALAIAGARRTGPGIHAAFALQEVLWLNAGRASDIGDGALDAAIEDMRAAARDQPDSPDFQADLGRLTFLKAARLGRAGDEEAAASLYAQSADAFRAALRRAPLASEARRGLLLVLDRQSGFTPESARLLSEVQQLDAGDFSGTIFAIRLGLRHWRALTGEQMLALGEAVRVLERSSGTLQGLIRLHASLPRDERIILEALLSNKATFDRVYRYMDRHGMLRR